MSSDHRTVLRESPANSFHRPDAISTIESSIPVGQTIAAYRRNRPAPPRRNLFLRLARA
jgi:hypothetical protein